MVLNEGQAVAFGPRDDVLAALQKANEKARAQVEARQTGAVAVQRPQPLPGGAA